MLSLIDYNNYNSFSIKQNSFTQFFRCLDRNENFSLCVYLVEIGFVCWLFLLKYGCLVYILVNSGLLDGLTCL